MHWALWDCDNVVFHTETGDTHLLSELPTLVLQLLQEQSLTTRQISERAAHACGAPTDAPWQKKIVAVLSNLEALELVQREQTLPP